MTSVEAEEVGNGEDISLSMIAVVLVEDRIQGGGWLLGGRKLEREMMKKITYVELSFEIRHMITRTAARSHHMRDLNTEMK